jgi:hypothetical protein
MDDEIIKLNLESDKSAANAENAPLQFDRMDSEATDLTCFNCNASIEDQYHYVNGRTACGACREQIEAGYIKRPGFKGFLCALIFGLGAAAIGFGVYYGVTALTGWEFGLVAIVVGLLVGFAVKKGCGGHGGWLYQLLAVFLTYAAIVSTYIPPALQEIAKDPETSTAGLTGIGYLAFLVVLFVLACAAPIMAGFENIIGWVIIAIGLYEAWKINKRRVMQISGPHQIGPAGAVQAAPPSQVTT